MLRADIPVVDLMRGNDAVALGEPIDWSGLQPRMQIPPQRQHQPLFGLEVAEVANPNGRADKFNPSDSIDIDFRCISVVRHFHDFHDVSGSPRHNRRWCKYVRNVTIVQRIKYQFAQLKIGNGRYFKPLCPIDARYKSALPDIPYPAALTHRCYSQDSRALCGDLGNSRPPHLFQLGQGGGNQGAKPDKATEFFLHNLSPETRALQRS